MFFLKKRSIEFILSFYCFIVSSFYRSKENIDFFSIALSFHRFIIVKVSFYRCIHIVLSLRFMVLSLYI